MIQRGVSLFGLPKADQRALTVLVPDAKNPKVQWEFGLVSARVCRLTDALTDYQVVWKLLRGTVRGNVFVQGGQIVKGHIAYYDPRLFEQTKLDFASWVWSTFTTPEELRRVCQDVTEAIKELPQHDMPTIDWNMPCRITTLKPE